MKNALYFITIFFVIIGHLLLYNSVILLEKIGPMQTLVKITWLVDGWWQKVEPLLFWVISELLGFPDINIHLQSFGGR